MGTQAQGDVGPQGVDPNVSTRELHLGEQLALNAVGCHQSQIARDLPGPK
jgi:hypothetical protein